MTAPRKQCAKCPWKTSTDPHDIPNGYSEERHAGLACTIARPGDFRGSARMMACHEYPPGAEKPCVGWLAHQLGPGNNIGLRLRTMTGAIDANIETVGPQHERFEDTLPKTRRRRKKKALHDSGNGTKVQGDSTPDAGLPRGAVAMKFHVQRSDGWYLYACVGAFGVDMCWEKLPRDSWDESRATALARQYGGVLVQSR